MEKNKDLEAKFNEEMEKWREHCKKTMRSSQMIDYVNCQAFKNIVSMGTEVLPLIRRAYDTEHSDTSRPGSLRWNLSYLVGMITKKELGIPDDIRGKIVEVADYTKKWLDENMRKYL